MTDDAELVRRSLADDTYREFDRRVERQGEAIADAITAEEFDNEAVTLGLELEVYAVREDDGELALARLPDDVFEGPAAKELGLHNAELNADPTRFDDAGIAAQAETLAADLAATRERAGAHDREIVLDAMWAVPPAEGTVPYLDDVDEWTPADGDGNGSDRPIRVAENMRWDPRYAALDNEAVRRAGGTIDFAVPGASLSFRTILFESLTTSIQPHVQVPEADAFPRYHNLAVRTLGPLLALTSNSPFLPADCYDVADARRLVEETHHELRIAAFEQSMNQDCRKVRVPRDLTGPTDAVEHVVADDTFAPFLREWIEDEPPAGDAADPSAELLDHCWEFDYKRTTFWRWVRGVAGGTSVDGACDRQSLRIEYRPLPTQPTVRDVVGVQVLTAGLLRGLVAADHPLAELPWAAAERSFYEAVEHGPDADLAWLTADGERTTDPGTIFDEVFAFARRGLDAQDVSAETQARYLDPLERRAEAGMTPSAWKVDRVREALADGASLSTALEAMQREYVTLSRERETFADWL